ncbi:MAG: DUF2029 domain-containing protein [Acidobacteriaceae bacterium]|nr:DUF2029 domain-containing protein [Acidobacteriaceae bacterium]
MLAALVACSRSSVGTPWFVIWLAVSGIAYLLAVREFFLTPRLPRHVILACLVLAALWRIPFLMQPPGPDDDIHRYLWDGRVQRLGYSPYNLVPADPAVASLHTADTRGLNNPDVPSPYPAGAQLFFRGVTAIHESLFAFKIAFVVCDFAIMLLLINMLRRSGQGEHWVLAYAWHPLLPLNVAGSSHVDILGVLLLLVSVAALGRGSRMMAAIALALAVGVKPLPIVLTPFYWRRVRVLDAVVGCSFSGCCTSHSSNAAEFRSDRSLHSCSGSGLTIRSLRCSSESRARRSWRGWRCLSASSPPDGCETNHESAGERNGRGRWQRRSHVRR